jgi:hypothetical protein
MKRFAILTVAAIMITPLALSSQAVRPLSERIRIPAVAPQETPWDRGELSEGTAVLLSTAATVLPFVAAGPGIFAGVMLGPSLGHFYAGNARRGVLGILVRSATLVATGALIANDESSNYNNAVAILATGALAIGVEAVVDILSTRNSVREANRDRPLVVARRPPARPATDSTKPVPPCVGVCR